MMESMILIAEGRKMVWDYPSHNFCIDSEEAAALGLPCEPLPEAQDHSLTAAILTARGQYHGFVPKDKSDAPPKPVPRRSGNRRSRAEQRDHPRVNGSERGGPEKRV